MGVDAVERLDTGASRYDGLPQPFDRWLYCVYDIGVEYEWDEAKSAANVAAGRPDFATVEGFEWETAMVISSDRSGEIRWAAIGLVGNRLYHVVFTERGDRTRIISLRPASRRERSRYVRGQA